jgi:pilus assembly protein CpaC
VVQKTPILGDLPIIGAAFSTKSFQEVESELVILITPYLVDPMACNQLPKYYPGQETRSPDDYELFLEGILEAPRGQRVLCPDGKYRAAYKSGPTSEVFPCGVGGCFGDKNCGAQGACGPIGGCGPNGACGPVNGGTAPSNSGFAAEAKPVKSTPAPTQVDKGAKNDARPSPSAAPTVLPTSDSTEKSATPEPVAPATESTPTKNSRTFPLPPDPAEGSGEKK